MLRYILILLLFCCHNLYAITENKSNKATIQNNLDISSNEKNKNSINKENIYVEIFKGDQDVIIRLKYSKNLEKKSWNIYTLNNPNRIVLDINTNKSLNIDIPKDHDVIIKYAKTNNGYRIVTNLIEKAKLIKTIHGDFIELRIQDIISTSGIISNVMNISNNNKIKNDFIVMIDAGHGGKDYGSIGRLGIAEKTLTLMYAKSLEAKLKKLDITTIMTRKDDTFIELYDRVRKTREGKADFMISIHMDAAENHKADRTTIYTMRPVKERELKWTMFKKDIYVPKQFLDVTDQNVFGLLYDITHRIKERKTQIFVNDLLTKLKETKLCNVCSKDMAYFAVLKSSDIPSILLEVGYITNPKAEMRLISAYYMDKVTTAISQSIYKYKTDISDKS